MLLLFHYVAAKTLVTEAASEYDKAKSILALELQKILIS
jgi:hypothetical protein